MTLTLAGRVIRTIAALTGLSVLLAGVPWGLAVWIGWPLPRSVPRWESLQVTFTPEEMIIRVLACFMWLAWAWFVIAYSRNVIALLREEPELRRLGGLQPIRVVVAALIGGVGLTLLAFVPRTAGVPAPAAEASVTTVQDGTARAGISLPGRVETPGSTTPPVRGTGHRTHTVKRGESLSGIAKDRLGKARRWKSIWRLNARQRQSDGRMFRDPSLIHPGWRLELPGKPSRDRAAPPPSTTAETPPAPSRAGRTPAPPATGPASHQEPPHERQAPVTIDLPSGSVVGMSFAAGVLSALAMARARRSARYVPAPPGTPPRTPAPEPWPALRRLTGIYRTRLAGESDDEPEHADPETGCGHAACPADGCRLPEAPEVRCSAVPAAAGTQDRDLPLDLTASPGIGLTGPGAQDAARAIVATLLLGRRRGAETEIVIPRDDATDLICPEAAQIRPGAVPGLVVTADLAEALDRVQADILQRTRLMADDDGEESDLPAWRQAHPGRLCPTVVLATSVSNDQRPAAEAVLAQGRPAGVHGLILSEWPSGATCHVAADGIVTASDPRTASLDGSLMFGLTQPDQAEVISLLAEARGPEETSPAAPAGPDDYERPDAAGGNGNGAESARPVSIQVLGPVRVHANGQQVTHGIRRAGFELLARLAVAHPDGVTMEAAIEDLWGDSPLRTATHRFHDATYSIRHQLRTLAGAAAEDVIRYDGVRYRINTEITDVDLVNFSDACQAGARARTDTDRIAAYERAGNAYSGDLAENACSEWFEPTRQHLRNQAIDAFTCIADASRESEPRWALSALDKAISLSPYAEELRRRKIRILVDLDRVDEARQEAAGLCARLDEIEAEPGDETRALIRRIGPSASPHRG